MRALTRNTLRTLGLAAIVASAIATPVSAQYYGGGNQGGQNPYGQGGYNQGGNWGSPNNGYTHLGTLQFGERGDIRRLFDRSGEDTERLMITATRNASECRSVTVTYGNGRTRNVFSGRIREGRPEIINLNGNERQIRSVEMNCRSGGRGASVVTVSAQVTSRVVSLATERFSRANNRETIIPVRNQRLRQIGLRAIDTDAVCERVVARFANGDRQVISGRGNTDIRLGRTVWFDLRGGQRDVVSIALDCAPASRMRTVSLEVLGERDRPNFPGPR